MVNEDGDTPLMNAMEDDHIEAARPLPDRGANTSVANHEAVTPLIPSHVEIVKLLFDKGADPTITNHHGNSPIHLAAQHGHLEIVQMLLDKGVD